MAAQGQLCEGQRMGRSSTAPLDPTLDTGAIHGSGCRHGGSCTSAQSSRYPFFCQVCPPVLGESLTHSLKEHRVTVSCFSQESSERDIWAPIPEAKLTNASVFPDLRSDTFDKETHLANTYSLLIYFIFFENTGMKPVQCLLQKTRDLPGLEKY